MTEEEKRVYSYWTFLDLRERLNKMVEDGKVDRLLYPEFLESIKRMARLEEPISQIDDKNFQKQVAEKYGYDLETTPIPSLQARARVKKAANVPASYLSFSKIIFDTGKDISQSAALQGWFRSHNVIEFLLLWEKEYNPDFDINAANELIAESNERKSPLTLKQWTARTKAMGIISIQGRYGGTYAHRIIAEDFSMWLSPKSKFDMLVARWEREVRDKKK